MLLLSYDMPRRYLMVAAAISGATSMPCCYMPRRPLITLFLISLARKATLMHDVTLPLMLLCRCHAADAMFSVRLYYALSPCRHLPAATTRYADMPSYIAQRAVMRRRYAVYVRFMSLKRLMRVAIALSAMPLTRCCCDIYAAVIGRPTRHTRAYDIRQPLFRY